MGYVHSLSQCIILFLLYTGWVVVFSRCFHIISNEKLEIHIRCWALIKFTPIILGLSAPLSLKDRCSCLIKSIWTSIYNSTYFLWMILRCGIICWQPLGGICNCSCLLYDFSTRWSYCQIIYYYTFLQLLLRSGVFLCTYYTAIDVFLCDLGCRVILIEGLVHCSPIIAFSFTFC